MPPTTLFLCDFSLWSLLFWGATTPSTGTVTISVPFSVFTRLLRLFYIIYMVLLCSCLNMGQRLSVYDYMRLIDWALLWVGGPVVKIFWSMLHFPFMFHYLSKRLQEHIILLQLRLFKSHSVFFSGIGHQLTFHIYHIL